MLDGTRLIHRVIASCDECPFRFHDQSYDRGTDAGWDCQHEQGGFRIADEGSLTTMQRCHDSVEMRLGKSFPDACPLPPARDTNPDAPERTRSIVLPDPGT